MWRWLTVVLAGMVLSACAHYISDDSLRLVDRTIPFRAVKENPDSYVGSYLLVGGKIAQVTNGKEGGEIEVIQVNLDSAGRPQDDFQNSGGRFLAQTGYFVDPAIYQAGTIVTMVGQVKGKKVRQLDAVTYTYPLLTIQELHLWRASELYGPYGDYPYPPYNYYYFPYDYPYSYGVCNFGYGPFPYDYGLSGCYLFPRFERRFFRPVPDHRFRRPHTHDSKPPVPVEPKKKSQGLESPSGDGPKERGGRSGGRSGGRVDGGKSDGKKERN